MARSQVTDFYQNYRFRVSMTTDKTEKDYLNSTLAGFTTCSLPTQTNDIAEYREGGWVYKRKYLGIASIDDITLSRGVAYVNSELFDWMKACNEGKEYRTTLEIRQYNRDGQKMVGDVPTSYNLARIITCNEAFPVSCKVGSDLDASSSDISVQELTICMESFAVKNENTNNIY
jgi:phage tail-like protein